jgi:uncharacterized protein YigA (DUF484 family)
MAQEPKPKVTNGRDRLTASQVADYLRRHPNFLNKFPDLLATLTPPSRSQGDGIVDMQQFMLERHRRDIEKLNHSYQELVETSRSNMSNQGRVHAGVLSLFGARTFENLIEIVTTDLAELLGVDVVTLCVEAGEEPLPRAVKSGLYILDPGYVDELLGVGRDAVLRPHVTGDDAVFGPAAGLVNSDALMRLRVSQATPLGLLALGSRRKEFFDPSQGTELLNFLARATEHSIRVWLNLPPWA